MKVLVTRAADQAGGLVSGLRSSGAEVVEFPTIKTVPPESWADLDRAIGVLSSFEYVIFTSVNALAYFMLRLEELGRGGDSLKALQTLKGITRLSPGLGKNPEMQKKYQHLIDQIQQRVWQQFGYELELQLLAAEGVHAGAVDALRALATAEQQVLVGTELVLLSRTTRSFSGFGRPLM